MRYRVLWLLLPAALACGGGGRPALEQPTPKVLVIGWDGVRADAVQIADTPTLDAAVATGAYSFAASTQTKTATVSAPGWLSILTGVDADKHGVTGNEDFPNHDTHYPSFLARARRLGFRTAAACDWELLCAAILANEDALDTSKVGDEDKVTTAMVEWLSEDDADVHFIHLDLPDHAGHASGFSPDNPDYIAAIEKCDALSGQLLDAVASRARRAHERWLVMFVTDHGGDAEGHGNLNEENRRVHLVMWGDGVIPGELPGRPYHMDIHPTVLKYLGVVADPAWNLDGHVIGLAP